MKNFITAGNRVPAFEIYGSSVFLGLIFILPFTHTTALRNVLLLLGLCYVLISFYKEGVNKFVPFKSSIILWLVVAWLSVIYTVDLSVTLKALRTETIYTVMMFYMGFILVWKGMKIEWVFLSSLIGFLAISIIALIHVQIDGEWLEESHIGARGWSNYLIVAMPILFYFLVKNISSVNILVALIAVIFFLYVGVLSEVRIIWLALLVQIFVAAGLYFKQYALSAKTKLTILILLGMLLLSSMLVLQYVNQERKAEDFLVSAERDPRIERWPKVINIISENPYYGLGFGREHFGEVYPEFDTGKKRYFTHAHNIFLDYGVMLGIPGVLVITLLFFSIAIYFYKSLKVDVFISSLGLILLAGILSKNMTDDFFIKDVSLTFWMLLGVLSGVIATKRDDLSSNV